MANSQAICTSFEREKWEGIHDFSVDILKASLYYTTGSLGYGTETYTATSEVSGMGYTAGGMIVSATSLPQSSGQTTFWQPGQDIIFPPMLIETAFDAVLIYNSSKANRAVGVWTFPSMVLPWAILHLSLPANTSATALVRVLQ